MEGKGLYVNLAVATIRMNATILIRTSSILKLDRIPLRFLSVLLKDDEEDILQCLICFGLPHGTSLSRGIGRRKVGAFMVADQ